jgi:hypothetical protein
MTKFLVTKKDASAFASGEGTFPVVDGVVDMPADLWLTMELLTDGTLRPMPVVEETKAVDESVPAPVPPVVDEPAVEEVAAEVPVEDNDEVAPTPKRTRKAK